MSDYFGQSPMDAAPPPGWPAKLVLASSSPRRRQLLAQLGVWFEVRPAGLDETPLPGEDARAHVERLSVAKASAVAAAGDVVLAADTIVELDGLIYGKPANAEDALRMLRVLRGRTHKVHTGVAVVQWHALECAVVTSRVRLVEADDALLDWYVSTGEAADKAGAYAVQGGGALLVAEIFGSPTNVIGLPLYETRQLLARLARAVRAAGQM